MAKRKLVLIAGALAATVLSGCAAYPYDDGYGRGYPDRAYYGDNDRGYYGPGYGPGYYTGPGYYVGPSIGFGITYSDRDYPHHRHWR
jgi:hypothetical protein